MVTIGMLFNQSIVTFDPNCRLNIVIGADFMPIVTEIVKSKIAIYVLYHKFYACTIKII